MSLDDVLPRLADAATERAGSKFLQMRLGSDSINDEEVDRIFREALQAACKLAGDANGGPVILKLVERISDTQRQALADRFHGQVVSVASTRPGSLVLRRLVELMPEDAAARLSSELSGKVMECVENTHGNHVIQALVKRLPAESLTFVIDEVASQVERMPLHMYGSRVTRALFERSPDSVERMASGCLTDLPKYIRDPHAIYLMHCLMEAGRLEDKLKIMQATQNEISELSKSKVASVIVERCFEATTPGVLGCDGLEEARASLLDALMGQPGDAGFRELIQDKIGGHTVVTVAKHLSVSERQALRERVEAAASVPAGAEEAAAAVAAVQKELEAPEGSPPPAGWAIGAGISKGSAAAGGDISAAKPCAWFWKPRGCQNGRHCEHCHLCPEGELKERKKQKRGTGGGAAKAAAKPAR